MNSKKEKFIKIKKKTYITFTGRKYIWKCLNLS